MCRLVLTLLTSLLLTLFAGLVIAEERNHQLICEVTGHSGYKIVEGVSTKKDASPWDWLEIGDGVLVEIKSGRKNIQNGLPIQLLVSGLDEGLTISEQTVVYNSSNLYADESLERKRNRFGTGSFSDDGQGGVSHSHNQFWFTQSQIYSYQHLLDRTMKLRAYSDDKWHGILTESIAASDETAAEIWTLDCETRNDQIDEILAASALDIEAIGPKGEAQVPKAQQSLKSEVTSGVANKYPKLPFDYSVEELSQQYGRDQKDQRLVVMAEVSLRCAGLLSLLARQRLLDGLDQDQTSLKIAEALFGAGGLWSFQTTYKEDYPSKTSEDLESYLSDTVARRTADFGELYAAWINEYGVVDENLADLNHPISKELNYCHQFGNVVLEGAKNLLAN